MQNTIEQYRTAALTPLKHFGYSGERPLFSTWGMTSFTQNRDSEALERSNFSVISKDLTARFPDTVEILQTRHFAVGWLDHLIFDTTDAATLAAVYAWERKLADYPVANEDHYSALVNEEADAAYDDWAKYLVRDIAEDRGLLALLNEDGDFEPSEAQAEQLRSLVADVITESARQDLETQRLTELMVAAFLQQATPAEVRV